MFLLSLSNEPAGSFLDIFLTIAVLLLTWFIGRCFYYVLIHPLSKVPGPKLYTISEFPYYYHLLRGDWHQTLKVMHDDYGPAVRFTPTEVSFITAEAMNKIYGHKPSGSLAFSKDTKIVYRRSGKYSSIIGANDEEHRRMRRLLAHAFSDNALRSQQVVLNRYVDLFIERVMPLAESGSGVVDLVRWYNFATFDVIGDLAFGRSFGCLESGGYNPWVRMIFANIKSYSFLIVLRRMSLEGLASLLTPSHLKRSVKEHKYLSEQTVMDRIASGNTEREDFISYILKHDGEKTMVTQEIIETAETLIVAGSETTATLLSGVTYQLLMNRDKLDILVEEIRSSFASVEDMTLQRVGQLPYLLAVLNEGLRMQPPIPSGLPRITPSGGELIEGYWIPGGTTVSVAHWAAFKSKYNFRDPESFVPERWLNDPRYAEDQKAVLQPFSMGPRSCIGKNLAYAEMRLILVRLLWHFDIELLPGSMNWYDQKVFIFWEKPDLDVKLTRVRY